MAAARRAQSSRSAAVVQKDLQLAATSAYENGVAMPMENAAKEAYALAIRNGMGDLDFSAIY